jgi:hypothetical protein
MNDDRLSSRDCSHSIHPKEGGRQGRTNDACRNIYRISSVMSEADFKNRCVLDVTEQVFITVHTVCQYVLGVGSCGTGPTSGWSTLFSCRIDTHALSFMCKIGISSFSNNIQYLRSMGRTPAKTSCVQVSSVPVEKFDGSSNIL